MLFGDAQKVVEDGVVVDFPGSRRKNNHEAKMRLCRILQAMGMVSGNRQVSVGQRHQQSVASAGGLAHTSCSAGGR